MPKPQKQLRGSSGEACPLSHWSPSGSHPPAFRTWGTVLHYTSAETPLSPAFQPRGKGSMYLPVDKTARGRGRPSFFYQVASRSPLSRHDPGPWPSIAGMGLCIGRDAEPRDISPLYSGTLPTSVFRAKSTVRPFARCGCITPRTSPLMTISTTYCYQSWRTVSLAFYICNQVWLS